MSTLQMDNIAGDSKSSTEPERPPDPVVDGEVVECEKLMSTLQTDNIAGDSKSSTEPERPLDPVVDGEVVECEKLRSTIEMDNIAGKSFTKPEHRYVLVGDSEVVNFVLRLLSVREYTEEERNFLLSIPSWAK